eukprot:COSAG02_NODE_1810_length_10825_cov_43.150848_10_plen_55_part_01
MKAEEIVLAGPQTCYRYWGGGGGGPGGASLLFLLDFFGIYFSWGFSNNFPPTFFG